MANANINHSNIDGSREIQELTQSLERLGNLSEKDKIKIAKNIQNVFKKNLNVLIAGATGSGKSTTIRALFDEGKMSEQDRRNLRISDSAKPQTMEIRSYKVGKNLTLWDSPGLGDGTKDDEHIDKIREKCREKDENGDGLIDLGLVIIGGIASRDLESTLKTIDVLVDELCVGEKDEARVVVAINKCDLAGNNPKARFDYDKNEPSDELKAELDEKIRGFKARFKENRSSKFRIMYYSAGYYDEKTQTHYKSYNLDKLLFFIIQSAPKIKRYIVKGVINVGVDDGEYKKKIEESWLDSLKEAVSDGIDFVGDMMDKVGDVAQKMLTALPVGEKLWNTGKAILDKIKPKWWPF